MSSLRHAHSHQDELVYILEGEPTLVTDTGEHHAVDVDDAGVHLTVLGHAEPLRATLALAHLGPGAIFGEMALVSDAHSTESLRLPDGKTVPAESIVAELNAVLTWVSVPNVRTEVKQTKDVGF